MFALECLWSDYSVDYFYKNSERHTSVVIQFSVQLFNGLVVQLFNTSFK